MAWFLPRRPALGYIEAIIPGTRASGFNGRDWLLTHRGRNRPVFAHALSHVLGDA